MSQSIFAKNILFLRKKRRLAQSEMPDKLGIKATTWSNYENDQTEPNVSTIIEISRFFGVTIDELLTVDLSSVNLIGEKEGGKKRANVNPNVNLNVNPSRPYSTESEPLKSMLHEPDPSHSWATFTILRQMDAKLDRLLNSVEIRPPKSP